MRSSSKPLYHKDDHYYMLTHSTKSPVEKSIRRRIWFTLWSALYLVMSLYFVAVANSRADQLNLNSNRPPERRLILPDPLSRFIIQLSTPILSQPPLSAPDNISLETIIVADELWPHRLEPPPSVVPPNFPDMLVTTSALLFILRFALTNHLSHALSVIRRVFLVSGTAYLLRAATVVMTVLPFPEISCESHRDPELNPWLDAFNLMRMTRISCGDVFFSGHSIVYTAALLCWTTYPVNWWSRTLVSLHFAIGVWALLATAYHYSIDILVGCFVVFTLWFVLHTALRIHSTLALLNGRLLRQAARLEDYRQRSVSSIRTISFASSLIPPCNADNENDADDRETQSLLIIAIEDDNGGVAGGVGSDISEVARMPDSAVEVESAAEEISILYERNNFLFGRWLDFCVFVDGGRPCEC